MDQYFWKHDKNELLEQLPKTTQRHIKYKPIQKKKKVLSSTDHKLVRSENINLP